MINILYARKKSNVNLRIRIWCYFLYLYLYQRKSCHSFSFLLFFLYLYFLFFELFSFSVYLFIKFACCPTWSFNLVFLKNQLLIYCIYIYIYISYANPFMLQLRKQITECTCILKYIHVIILVFQKKNIHVLITLGYTFNYTPPMINRISMHEFSIKSRIY